MAKNKTQKISSGIITDKQKQTWIEKTLLWIRGNFFIPDARVLWVKPSVSFLKKYLQENQIETVITTGPPHSIHLIGLQLKKELSIKWIADFRDPWTTIGYHNKLKLTTKSQAKHKHLEKEVLTNCNQIIVTSPTTKTLFQNITSKPISIITNGYDIEKIIPKPMDVKFTLAHIGSLLSERNPTILWETLYELTQENNLFAKHFQLKLIGAVSTNVLQSLQNNSLLSYIDNLGYLSHEMALQEQRCSQVLLLIEIDSKETQCIIPGKIFEYIVSSRPIVAMGAPNADLASIIQETNTGKFFTYNDKENLKSYILHLFNQFQNNELQVYPVGLQKYFRKNLTQELVTLFNNQ